MDSRINNIILVNNNFKKDTETILFILVSVCVCMLQLTGKLTLRMAF